MDNANDTGSGGGAVANAGNAQPAHSESKNSCVELPQISYGSLLHQLARRVHVGFQAHKLSPHVLDFIWSSIPEFGRRPSPLSKADKAPKSEHSVDVGEVASELESQVHRWSESSAAHGLFTKCIDYPRLPGHIYYEGYFHGMPQGTPMHSFNPRTMVPFDKPAAPPVLRAFLAALRAANPSWAAALERKLRALSTVDASSSKKQPAPNAMANMLANIVARGRMFSDLAVQVHCGDAVPDAMIGWHNDGPNSLLHLSITLAGRRTLWMSASDQEVDGRVKERKTELQAGDIYLSSPTLLPHAPQYPQSSWDTRTVAIQCRLNLNEDEMFAWAQSSEAQRHAISRVIADMVGRHSLVMPSLEQIKQFQQTINPRRTAKAPPSGCALM